MDKFFNTLVLIYFRFYDSSTKQQVTTYCWRKNNKELNILKHVGLCLLMLYTKTIFTYLCLVQSILTYRSLDWDFTQADFMSIYPNVFLTRKKWIDVMLSEMIGQSHDSKTYGFWMTLLQKDIFLYSKPLTGFLKILKRIGLEEFLKSWYMFP